MTTPKRRVKTHVAQLVRAVFHRHCYRLVIDRRRMFLRCEICGEESPGYAPAGGDHDDERTDQGCKRKNRGAPAGRNRRTPNGTLDAEPGAGERMKFLAMFVRWFDALVMAKTATRPTWL
jgi:hypothetical protein